LLPLLLLLLVVVMELETRACGIFDIAVCLNMVAGTAATLQCKWWVLAAACAVTAAHYTGSAAL
jgi:hypothetical protein